MQQNARVIVIVNGKLELSYSDIIQISGRGNRSQGIPEALCILTKAHPDKGEDLEAILKANAEENPDDGVTILSSSTTNGQTLLLQPERELLNLSKLLC